MTSDRSTTRLPAPLLMLAMAVLLAVFYRSESLPMQVAALGSYSLLALILPAAATLFVLLTAPPYLIPARIMVLRDGGIQLPLFEIVLLIALGATLARDAAHVLRGRLKLPRPTAATLRHYAPHALFLLLGVVGVVLALPNQGYVNNTRIDPKSAALREFRWLIIEPLLFYALLMRHRDVLRAGVARVPPAIAALTVAGVVIAVVGISQPLGLDLVPLFGVKVTAPFTPDNLIEVGNVVRATSVYGNPNNLGLFLGRIWPLALMSALLLWRSGQRAARPLALVYLLAALIVLAGIVVSISRGAWVGVMAAVVVLATGVARAAAARANLPIGAWVRRPAALRVLGIAVLLLVGALVGFALRGGAGGGSTSVRAVFWREAVAMLQAHPLGIGLDQFYYYHNPDVGGTYADPSLLGTSEQYAAHPHNLVLDIWLRMGPLGLVAFGWLCWRAIRHGWQAMQRATGPQGILSVGALAALAAAFTHGLVDHFYFLPDIAMTFWMLLALLAVLAESDPSGRDERGV